MANLGDPCGGGPTADTSETIAKLVSFLCENKWENAGKLQVAHFAGVRGVRTVRNLDYSAGETLIDMPFKSLFISLITLMDDNGFRKHCLERLEGNIVSTQLLLAVYVVYQKHLGDKSKWQAYIESLPRTMSTPHFCTQTELDCVPLVRHLVSKAVQGIFKSFEDGFARTTCECCGMKLIDIITRDELILMFFLVNSRSVYCDPRIIKNNCSGKLPVADEPNMALAPFLDMINHSDSVETESQLYLEKDTSQLRYRLITKTALNCTEEIVISYGNHENFKLLMEYGFVIVGNRHEKIDLSIDQIENFMRNYPRFFHQKKVAFIKDQGMHQEVFISADGLSYNLEVIFKIFKSAALTEKSLSEVAYQQSTTTVPVDESVDVEMQLYLYLIDRFKRTADALNGLQQLSESGVVLREFFEERIRFLSRLIREIESNK